MPKVYQEMDPEVALKIIEGYEDELTGESKKQEAFYRQFRCPRCGGECIKHFISAQHAFPQDGDVLLPRSGLKCKLCDCLFDPHTNLIITLGNAGKINERLGATMIPNIGGGEEDH